MSKCLFLVVFLLGFLPDILEALHVVVEMVLLLLLALPLLLVGFPVFLHGLNVNTIEASGLGLLERLRMLLTFLLLRHEFFYVQRSFALAFFFFVLKNSVFCGLIRLIITSYPHLTFISNDC